MWMDLVTPTTHRIHKPRQQTAAALYASPQIQTYIGSATARAPPYKTQGTQYWTSKYPTSSVTSNFKPNKSSRICSHSYRTYAERYEQASLAAPID